MAIRIDERDGIAVLHVKIVPGASRTRIVGLLGDAVKIAVSAPPVGGRANEAVIAVIAETLSVPVRAVRLVAGATQPRKQVGVEGLTADQLRQRLADTGAIPSAERK